MADLNHSNRAKIVAVLKAHPSWGYHRISGKTGIAPTSVKRHLAAIKKQGGEPEAPNISKLAQVAQRMLSRSAASPSTLAKGLGVGVEVIPAVLESLEESGLKIVGAGELLTLAKPDRGFIGMGIYSDKWQTIGLVADTHLAAREERLDAVHAVYDRFEHEGIKTVFHAGNIVEGYIEKINAASVICSTSDDQIQYCIDHYPSRKGIVTHYITGDDHEGWWIKEGHNWGRELMLVAESQGRKDLRYIGHVEADVELKTDEGSSVMKIQHPGGGSSYARSYTAQKQVEAFQGGEKPAILVQGHYHVNNYMLERNVHVIGMPGFQDQTVFARKKRLRMDVGGVILRFRQNPRDGAILELSVQHLPFFDRGYYRKYLRSDVKALSKGHLVLKR